MFGKRVRPPGVFVALICVSALAVWWVISHSAIKSVAFPSARPVAQQTGIPPLPQKTTSSAEHPSLGNTDRRLSKEAPPKPDAGRESALAKLKETYPEVQVEFDEITGGPKSIMAVGKFLSQPLPNSGYDSVLQFIDANHALFGHTSAALAPGKSRITREDLTTNNGMRTVVWQQELEGIPFFQTILRANLTKNGELITLGGNYLSAPEKVEGDAGKRSSLIEKPPVAATKAIALAAENIGTHVEETDVSSAGGSQGVERKQKFSAPSISDTSASLTWVPVTHDSADLAWDVTIMSTQRGEMFRVLVDVENGEVLVRQSLTNYISNASYRVFARSSNNQPYDSPTPMSPGHATPLATQPAAVPAELVTLGALNTTASPNGWINDGDTQTLGNNVDAHTDTDANNSPDLPRPTSPSRTFDFPINFANAPGAYKDAAVTNLFYLNNWVHDKLYELGFTETAGNFQTDNFSRGGMGNDAVQADAQDGSGTNNANFSTPVDGSPGRMQMYMFTGPTPDIDGDLDSEIVIHEYVHGLSNRLVGGGVGISQNQTQGMGEGWSDFYSMSLLSEPGDNINGNYAAGSYVTRQFSSLTQNYYYGIRRYPYSTDLTKSPLTFKDIDPVQASNHAGIPRSPAIGSTANEVHNEGEVWCVTLWEMRANLITKFGYSTGNQLALQLATNAMKLCPANPNFLQSRDAILQADLVGNAGANAAVLWAAFAKRGMGAGATSPSSSSTAGIVESYNIPDNLAVSPLGGFTAIGQSGSTITPTSQVFTLSNSGATVLNWTASKTQPWLALSSLGGNLASGLTTTVTASFNAAANSLPPGSFTDTVSFTNSASGVILPRSVNLTIEPQYIPIFWEPFESGLLASAWSVTGNGPQRTLVTSANTPHAGIYHLTMDSSSDGTYARNEATLTLNLAGRTDVTLCFWVKMFNDEADAPATNPFTTGADFDGVAVSSDGGATWYEIRDLRTISNSWQKITLDLDAALAARGLSYTANFKIRFNHYDNYTISTDGFAFDDILVAQAFTNSLTITAPDSATEGDAPVNATVFLNPAPIVDTVVALSSSNSDATVPPTVTVPAGVASATFLIAPDDDALLDGSQTATITASLPTFSSATKTFVVHDNETATLTMEIPDNAVEGSSPLTGIITVSSAVGKAVTVSLTSDSSSVMVPLNVIIPAGAGSAQFTLLLANDTKINGIRPVAINASVAGWAAATDSITILDDEPTILTVGLPALREGDMGKTGTLTISGTLDHDLEVQLASTDNSELTAPSSVIIPAGQTSASIPLTVVNDAETDGSQTVTLRADANGFPHTSATTTVSDNDAHHFTVSAIAAAVLRNSPVALGVSARDVNDELITNYAEVVSFTAKDASQAAVTLTPVSSGAFANGILSTPISFTSYGSGVALAVADQAGHTGTSNTFDIVSGPLDHFTWNPIASPQHIDAPFSATIRALDVVGNPITAFEGHADLSAYPSGKVEVLTWTTYADTSPTGEYAQTKQAISSYFTNYHETTTTATTAAALAAALVGKQVFLIVEQENSTASTLGSLGTAWTAVLNSFVNAGGSVIACSNTTSEHLILNNSGLMNATPISSPTSIVVNKTTETPLNAGVPVTFTGSYLHTYASTNGTSHLITSAGEPVVISRTIGTGRVVLIGTDYYTLGTGMDRVIANAIALAQSVVASGLPIAPTTTGNFIAGEWTGNITIPFADPNLRLRATIGAYSSDSNAFAVEPVQQPSSRATVFAETYESGGLNPDYWTSTGTGNFRTQVTSSYVPHAGNFHMTMDTTSGAARNEATLTLDLAARNGAVLKFWAAGYSDEPNGPPPSPFVNGANFDGVAISADGTTWWEVQALRSLPSTYAEFTVDLDAAIAAHGIGYTSTFKIRFNQYDDNPLTTDGIVIDDITVTAAVPPAGLAISLPAQATEGAGAVTGMVNLTTPLPQDLVVTLSSKAAGKVSVPPMVLVPAGESSAAFPLNILDDPFVDGEKTVNITASATGFPEVWAALQIVDNDGGTITLSLPPASFENAGGITGSILLSSPAIVPLTVQLSSNAPSVAQVPIAITLARGVTTATFPITIPDDTLVDGDQIAQLTASLSGWTAGNAPLLVQDNESRNLTVSIPASFRETDGPKTGTVSLGGSAASDLIISLTSSDTSEITVPATLTIPTGQTSAPFPITIQDDLAADGSQPFTITASSATFNNGTASGQVRDNEAHHFTFAAIGGSQLRNGPVPAIVTARDSLGTLMTDYNATISLSASGNTGPLVVSPANGTGFINGVWSGSLLIDALDTGVTLTAADGLGATGTSNPFDLVDAQIDHFVWNTIPGSQTVDTPFTTTVSAVDSSGSVVSAYNGIVNLFALASTQSPTIGLGETSINPPFLTYSHDSRSVMIYKASEIGGGARLTAMGFNLTTVPPAPEVLANFKIRLKHTSLAAFPPDTPWDNAGWTTVYQAGPVISATGWMTFTFTTPFDFNGIDNLMVDVCMDRASTNNSSSYVQATNTAGTTTLYATSESTNGSPLTWSGTTPYPSSYSARPDIRLSSVREIPVRPGISESFSNGTWTGPVSVPISGSSISLKARAGSITGTSNPFDVGVPSGGSSNSATVFTETYETGSLNPAYWTSTGTGNFRTQVTSSYSPHGGTYHMTMDTTSSAARNEPTLTLNLAGRTGVKLNFWAAGYNDEANGPPASPFIGGADFDGVAISADGVTWWEVQSLRSLPGTYAAFTVDLDAAIAAHGISYTSVFKIRFNQYDDNPLTTDGIVIDDISVTADSLAGFTFTTPPQVTEGDGLANASVTIPVVSATDTLINLASLTPAEITVPPSVTIPAGLTSAVFSMNILDDFITDGNRNATISGTIPLQAPLFASITVIDNESLPMSLSGPSILTEVSGLQSLTLVLGAAPSGVVAVNLTSSDTSEITLPASVVFQPGQTTAVIPLTVVNDSLIDGTQSVELTASVTGWTAVTTTVQVADDETRILSLSGPYSAYEGGTSSGSVGITGTLPADLLISLSSSNPSQFSVPASVIIPAGSTSVSFTGTPVDDSATDGSQQVTITASAATFQNALATAYAYDNDVHHFNISSIASSVIRGAAVNVYVTAMDVDNSPINVFSGPFTLSADASGAPVSLTTATTPNFSSGLWSSNVVFTGLGSGVVLRAADSGGHTGASNAFTVAAAAASILTWSPLPSPVETNTPFAATLTARDPYGYTDTNFNGTAALKAGLVQRTTGTGTNEGSQVFYQSAFESRVQSIYLASELGGAGKITGLGLDVSRVPSLPLTRFTIRIKPTSLAAYSPAGWESTGWTIVYQSNLSVTHAGWLMLPFGTPFTYNGTGNLMVDFSFDNAATGTSGLIRGTSVSTTRCYYSSSFGTNGDPLTWSGTTPFGFTTGSLPNLKLRMEQTVPVNPTTVALTNGVWNGSASVGTAGAALSLTADTDSGLTGESNAITATPSALMTVTPNAPLTATSPYGGPAVPNAKSYTITNIGDAALTWTAGKNAPWLDLSVSGGTLAPGAAITLQAALNATSLNPISYNDTLTFTNTTNGRGNTTRAVTLSISLSPPAIVAEPAFTPTTANTIEWSPVSGAASYEVQCSADADFTNPASSGWITGTSHAFTHLIDGTTYHYRIRSTVLPGDFDSAWSGSVASTQDATPPELARTSNVTSATPIVMIQGGTTDATSGVASVTVNGQPVTTADGFGSWSSPVVFLFPGDNHFTVTVSDNVSPPNSYSEEWIISYESSPAADTDGDKLPDDWEIAHGLNPADNGSIDSQQGTHGDPDKDSISNLMEYALGLDPAVSDRTGLPIASLQIHAGDGLNYLSFHYRRRIQPGGLHYQVETNTTLDGETWNDSAADLEETGVTPNADGTTEDCTVRIHPSTDVSPRKFVRLRVLAD